MQIPRFFFTRGDAQPIEVSQSQGPAGSTLDFPAGTVLTIVNQDMIKQIKHVLRLSAGSNLILLSGSGLLFHCRLVQLSGKEVLCHIETREQMSEITPRVSVALSLIKGDRFDWALQKLTELGVHEVTPLLTERTVVKLDSADERAMRGKITRWQTILREAAEQCERATIPHLVPPQNFDRHLTEITGGGTANIAYICAERMQSALLKDMLLQSKSEPADSSATAGATIHLLVGPEGGFTAGELSAAQEAGVMPVSLGNRILRSETAAIFALSQVIWCLEK